MSIASDYVSSLNKSIDKTSVKRRMIAKSTKKSFGEDMLYYFEDKSILVHRFIVNEFQLFKGC